MAGNVEEWVQDWYVSGNPADPQTDPIGPESGTARGRRGGDFENGIASCTSTERSSSAPTRRSEKLGFRVARSAE